MPSHLACARLMRSGQKRMRKISFGRTNGPDSEAGAVRVRSALVHVAKTRSERANVLRLRALLALGDLELDLLVLVEGPVTGARDGREVGEDVSAAVVRSD